MVPGLDENFVLKILVHHDLVQGRWLNWRKIE
jgi:hypothetical protein